MKKMENFFKDVSLPLLFVLRLYGFIDAEIYNLYLLISSLLNYQAFKIIFASFWVLVAGVLFGRARPEYNYVSVG